MSGDDEPIGGLDQLQAPPPRPGFWDDLHQALLEQPGTGRQVQIDDLPVDSLEPDGGRHRRRMLLAAVAAVTLTLVALTVVVRWRDTSRSPSASGEPAAASTSHVPLRTVVMTDVEISDTDSATFEQIHPVPGPITLSTSSTTELLACPGGWWGSVTRSGAGSWGSLWLGEDCIPFSASNTAVLPSVATTDQHYAIAVVATTGAVTVQELRLTYRPGDESQMCFVAMIERPCQ
jgi:hypothetical protein